MSYKVEKLVSSPEEILQQLPLSQELQSQVQVDREVISQIIEGKDKRKLLVIGPCSAWPNTAVIEYAKKLKVLADKYADKIKIVMRVYTQKPRTSLGWTGSANQVNPFSTPDLEEGIIYCRKMMLEVLEIGLPIADEALFTHNEGYFSDLLSWIAIGARSSEDQEHRLWASMIAHPVGLKNPSSGNLDIAFNSVLAAQNSHTFLLSSRQIRSSGNAHAHIVLRGGNGESNIYLEDLQKVAQRLDELKLKNSSIMVDVSHDNSIDPSSGKKEAKAQVPSLLRVLDHMNEYPQLNEKIHSFMVESFLLEGNQNINQCSSIDELNLEGLSITDACIGFEQTEKLLKEMYEKIQM